MEVWSPSIWGWVTVATRDVAGLNSSWWRHQMETFSALLAICAGNSPVTGEFSAQRPVTRSFDVFFDPHLNKRLSNQSWGWWFETPSCPLWRHNNDVCVKFAKHLALSRRIYIIKHRLCMLALCSTAFNLNSCCRWQTGFRQHLIAVLTDCPLWF